MMRPTSIVASLVLTASATTLGQSFSNTTTSPPLMTSIDDNLVDLVDKCYPLVEYDINGSPHFFKLIYATNNQYITAAQKCDSSCVYVDYAKQTAGTFCFPSSCFKDDMIGRRSSMSSFMSRNKGHESLVPECPRTEVVNKKVTIQTQECTLYFGGNTYLASGKSGKTCQTLCQIGDDLGKARVFYKCVCSSEGCYWKLVRLGILARTLGEMCEPFPKKSANYNASEKPCFKAEQEIGMTCDVPCKDGRIMKTLCKRSSSSPDPYWSPSPESICSEDLFEAKNSTETKRVKRQSFLDLEQLCKLD